MVNGHAINLMADDEGTEEDAHFFHHRALIHWVTMSLSITFVPTAMLGWYKILEQLVLEMLEIIINH